MIWVSRLRGCSVVCHPRKSGIYSIFFGCKMVRWLGVALLVMMVSQVIAQHSRSRSQATTEASDYYYDDEEPPVSKPSQKDNDQKQPLSNSTKHKDQVPEEEANEDAKSKKNSPHSLFLKPRNHRPTRVSPHPAARPKPTLPSFIKHPPALGEISTTVTPKPRHLITEATKAPIQVSKTKTSKGASTTTVKPTNGSRFNRQNGSSKTSKRSGTTEAPITDDNKNRRFGHAQRTKNTTRPNRFRQIDS